ncbi:MAG: hypothetical protein FWG30_08695 [Eubacteriaceae bacterium]|nr:hypothetical protein [Eubacteriaceae bacterium]
MSTAILPSLFISLALTIILETVFLLIIGVREKGALMLAALANIVTNPAVVLLYWIGELYLSFPLSLYKALLEACAIATEGYIYSTYTKLRRPYLLSLGANMFSFWCGEAIQIFWRAL